ncbi:MAG: GNAT family N-acetyltransferase [Pseudomonadota bacterium]
MHGHSEAAKPMSDVRYHDSINVLQEMFGETSTETERGTLATGPFDRPEWFRLLCDSGLVPLVVGAQSGDKQVALTLAEDNGRIASLRNWYSFTWRPLGDNSTLRANLLREIAATLKRRAHRVTLEPVPDEDDSARQLCQAFSETGWRVEVVQCDTNHVQHTAGLDFSDYWAERPGHLRNTLKRKRKLVDVCVTSEFIPTRWAEYESIYAASWKPREDYPAMLRAFAEAEAAAGRMRLGLAYHNGHAVAAQLWTVEQRTAYIHKLAHLETHKKLSAGTTLTAAMFKQVIERDKVALVDFGTGDQAYKADWMSHTRPRYRIDCLNRKAPRAWWDLAQLTARRLQASEVPMLAQHPAAV